MLFVTFNRKYLEHFVEHMPVETEKKAHKLLYICEERNMQEQGIGTIFPLCSTLILST